MIRSGPVSRKLALVLVSSVACALLFGPPGAEAKTPRRTFGAISLRNEGQVARRFDVNIFQARPRHHEKLAESASVSIGAGGEFTWNRAIAGRRYRVQVTAQPDGRVVYDGTNEAGAPGGALPIAIDANPGEEDPRDTRIASLEQRLLDAAAAADARVATVSAGYDVQIAGFQRQLVDAAAASDARVATVSAAYDAEIADLDGQISGLNTQVSDLQAQVFALQAELAYVPLLTAERDASFAAPTVVAGSTKVQVAQFKLTASDDEAVSVSQLRLDKDLDKDANLHDLSVEIDGVQFGATRTGVGDSQASMDFNGLHTIAAGGTATVRVYCEVKSGSTAHTASTLIDLIDWIACGDSTGASATFPGAVAGHDVTITK